VIVTVTLNAAIDRTLTVPNFQLGHRHRASQGLTLADISLEVEAKNGKAARRRKNADLIFGTFPAVRVSASVTRAVRLDGTNAPEVRVPLIPRGMAIPLGRVQFLQRQYKDAVASFERVLQIDPEDLQAHYNLMLCYRGLGQPDLAARSEALYRRFKADESAQAITGPYRQLHADDNNERQSVHEHVSAIAVPAGTSSSTSRPRPSATVSSPQGLR